MLNALALSLAQLGDRAILGVLARTLALTLAILGVLGTGLVWLARTYGDGWFAGSGTLATLLAAAGAVVGAILLFRAVAVAVVGLFADSVVGAVERRHYPAAAARAGEVPFRRAARFSLWSAGRALGFNLAALPPYLALLPTGIGAPALFVGVNALLLGRDLGEMVGSRHLDDRQLADWLATSRATRTATGLAVAILFVVPFVNLLAPVLGPMIATHRFHRSRPA